MKYAIVDIGSNTVKMSIFSEEGALLQKEQANVGLIGYLQNGKLSLAGQTALIQTLLSFQHTAHQNGISILYPFATASLRAAQNAEAVLAAVREQTDLRIELVSGEEEAALSLAGITLAMKEPVTCGTLLDMGGGSCEIVSFENGVLHQKPLSLPLGTLVLFSRFVQNILPTKEEIARVKAYVHTLAAQVGLTPRSGKLLAVGGTVRAVCAYHASLHKCESTLPYTLTYREGNDLMDRFCQATTETKLSMLRQFPNRIHTVPVGLGAYLALMECLEQDTLTVVEGGAREGYFLKIQAQQKKELHHDS